MLSGIQEILILSGIILCIFVFPHFLCNNGQHRNILRQYNKSSINLTRKLRLIVVGSVLWPLSFAIYIKLWEKTYIPFIIFGLGPVVLFWSAVWIKAGTKE